MGVWSIAILDGGVANAVEETHGRNLYERDILGGDFESDPGGFTHGTNVALSVELINPRLDRIDIRIMDSRGVITASNAAAALDHLAELHDAGWNISTYNASWGSNASPAGLTDEIDALAARGIYGVAASGNAGRSSGFEYPGWPARLDNVIAVGSHDGAGNPTGFSQMRPGSVHVLADGEDVPGPGINGTSFAAPQVTATVGTVQALANAALERPLSFDELVDVLQLGGAGPLSSPDPADGSSRYFLHTHDGSVGYFRSTYLEPEIAPWEYLASNPDLIPVFAANPGAALDHFVGNGIYEGREVSFDGLRYVASHADLIADIGADRTAAALHWIDGGAAEGRATTFDPESYLLANRDLYAVFGGDLDAATRHYITNGFQEGRSTEYVAPTAVSEGAADLPRDVSTSGYVSVGQSVTGSISRLYDRDWYRTDLAAGQSISIEVTGSWTGGGTLRDPMGRVYGASGEYLAGDDDSGVGLETRFLFTAPSTGTYFLEADGWGWSTGSYTLSVTAARSSPVAGAQAAGVEDGLAGAALDPVLQALGETPDFGVASPNAKGPALYDEQAGGLPDLGLPPDPYGWGIA